MPAVAQIIQEIGQQAKKASYALALVSSEEKKQALKAIATAIASHRSQIKSENALDVANAMEDKLSSSLIDRLKLNDSRIDDMIASVLEIAELPDPVGKLITSKTLDNGLELRKIRVPIGVIATIFESRPNVVSDVAALTIKSGNAVILRGGKEALHTNRAIFAAIEEGITTVGFPKFSVQLIPVQDREAVALLCRLNEYVDVIIPRGGEGLIKTVCETATIPVIKHYKGVCHIFVDESANFDMALAIIKNAKCQRPSACNAAETILVHKNVSAHFLPKLHHLFTKEMVAMRGDEQTRAILPDIAAATEEDWRTEYLDLMVSIKVVANIDDAIHHINTYGSHHSDTIVSEDKKAQNQFVREVDSAAVYINASTRLTDGGIYGLGAEMGISTDKLHARGPMGVAELTTYKWVGIGNGQVR